MNNRLKSRTYRRVYKKLASRTTLHYKKRKPKKSHCAICGAELHGTLRERPYKMVNVAKTKKRPSRPFGGVLCSSCMRRYMVESAEIFDSE